MPRFADPWVRCRRPRRPGSNTLHLCALGLRVHAAISRVFGYRTDAPDRRMYLSEQHWAGIGRFFFFSEGKKQARIDVASKSRRPPTKTREPADETKPLAVLFQNLLKFKRGLEQS